MFEGAIERLFGGTSKDSGSVVESSENGGATAGAPDLAALRSTVGKGRNKSKVNKVEQAQLDAAQQAALSELFDNENWEEIASLYFDVRFALTGFEYFKLSEKQKRILGKSMGTCMQLLLQIDPRYVALIVFSVNFGAYVTDKEMAWKHFQAKAAWEKAQREGVRHG